VRVWTRFVWLGSSGRLLWRRQWIFELQIKDRSFLGKWANICFSRRALRTTELCVPVCCQVYPSCSSKWTRQVHEYNSVKREFDACLIFKQKFNLGTGCVKLIQPNRRSYVYRLTILVVFTKGNNSLAVPITGMISSCGEWESCAIEVTHWFV
jgi:hypothetical protein